MPLNDADPYLLAQELDLFQKYRLDVKFSQELGWASVQDEVSIGEFTAAQSIMGFPLCTWMKDCSIRMQFMITPLITSLQGNAITIAKASRDEGSQTPRNLLKYQLIHLTPPFVSDTSKKWGMSGN